jgi:periplasmic divalent cation tolerance protein
MPGIVQPTHPSLNCGGQTRPAPTPKPRSFDRRGGPCLRFGCRIACRIMSDFVTRPTGRPVVASTTAPSVREANSIARALVERRLAACVQILEPIRSVYRWEGEVREDPEVLLLIKSLDSQVSSIEELLRELHPYEVPELLAVPVTAGSEPYLRWLIENVGRPVP